MLPPTYSSTSIVRRLPPCLVSVCVRHSIQYAWSSAKLSRTQRKIASTCINDLARTLKRLVANKIMPHWTLHNAVARGTPPRLLMHLRCTCVILHDLVKLIATKAKRIKQRKMPRSKDPELLCYLRWWACHGSRSLSHHQLLKSYNLIFCTRP